MMKKHSKILVYGFGNPGRQDDGLGPAFAALVDDWKTAQGFHHIHTDSNYQLNVEDALLISEFDIVVFADATVEEDVSDFRFETLDPSKAEVRYTLHAASPGYILGLCHTMYRKHPDTRLMRIRGYEWDMKEGCTATARNNLQKAFEAFVGFCNQV
jgi:hydrogenase maturation protease